ncbi:hypothetical protein [Streptomyces sp. NPDC001315]|uniref:hypothetical protein n=1 Tax=Streptomyces sp. NPDC001315 TaxID=3364562 RepID=UPI00368468D0
MGVFARLLRRSKATEEATEEAGKKSAATEDQADAPAAVPEVTEIAEVAGSEETRDAAEATVDVVVAAEADGDEGVTAADGVEIPKQQSAEGATDREAGEDART